MLKIETLTELENLTDFDTVYEVISMQAFKYSSDWETGNIIDNFEKVFPLSNGDMVYNLLNTLVQFEIHPELDILNRPSLAKTLAKFYTEN
jgi:hypothetical protein